MTFTQYILKALHKAYVKLFVPEFDIVREVPNLINSADEASDAIYNLLTSDEPCMIARYGSTELLNITNYKSIASRKHSALAYIQDEQREWWWNEKSCEGLRQLSGFFPNTKENIARFACLMCEDTAELDMYGAWCENEKYMQDLIPAKALRCRLQYLEPYWATNPWSRALEGKRVLVIHPFAELIKQQYQEHRAELFEDKSVLPKFTLITIKAVQSLGGEDNGFKDWFEALDYMKREMDSMDYDIALIGCGAYGFPLAAHAKRTGNKAVHLGGALQLLFGIRGNRWDNPMYGVKEWGLPQGMYSSLPNEFWVRPGEENKSKNAEQVEGSCYW